MTGYRQSRWDPQVGADHFFSRHKGPDSKNASKNHKMSLVSSIPYFAILKKSNPSCLVVWDSEKSSHLVDIDISKLSDDSKEKSRLISQFCWIDQNNLIICTKDSRLEMHVYSISERQIKRSFSPDNFSQVSFNENVIDIHVPGIPGIKVIFLATNKGRILIFDLNAKKYIEALDIFESVSTMGTYQFDPDENRIRKSELMSSVLIPKRNTFFVFFCFGHEIACFSFDPDTLKTKIFPIESENNRSKNLLLMLPEQSSFIRALADKDSQSVFLLASSFEEGILMNYKLTMSEHGFRSHLLASNRVSDIPIRKVTINFDKMAFINENGICHILKEPLEEANCVSEKIKIMLTPSSEKNTAVPAIINAVFKTPSVIQVIYCAKIGGEGDLSYFTNQVFFENIEFGSNPTVLLVRDVTNESVADNHSTRSSKLAKIAFVSNSSAELSVKPSMDYLNMDSQDNHLESSEAKPEATIEQKLKALGFNTNPLTSAILSENPNGTSLQQFDIPKPSSITEMLKQSLNSNDLQLLGQCLSRTEYKLISASVSKLTAENVVKLIDTLAKEFEKVSMGGRNSKPIGGTSITSLVRWIKITLTHHLPIIASHPNLCQSTLIPLYQAIEARRKASSSVSKLLGRLELLDEQIRFRREKIPTESYDASPQVVINEDGSNEDFDDLDDMDELNEDDYFGEEEFDDTFEIDELVGN